MKTAISVPETTFELVTERARELGISRSEFFTTAAQRYLEELHRDSLTAQIDQAISTLAPDDSAGAATSVGRDRLARSEW